MSEMITFTLDDQTVTAAPGETLWQVAKRINIEVPHLCYLDEPGYRADGNCRACVVQIEGERVLAASCLRTPTEGMVVNTANERARSAQRGVFELLLADQPLKDVAHDVNSKFWQWAEYLGIEDSRYPARQTPAADTSHPAMHVALDACINCNLCVRACREVQVNDVIGMAYRGSHSKIVFDIDDAMGSSSCVACGECVQACPTGALMEAALVDESGVGKAEDFDEIDSVCPYCGVGCQLTYQVKDDAIVAVQGRNGPSNENRLCVKGRFGFDYVRHSHRLTTPLIRRDEVPKSATIDMDSGDALRYFREASWEEALQRAGQGLTTIRDRDGGDALAGFGSAKCSNEEAYMFQKLIRTGFNTNNVDHCTRLCHASSVVGLLEAVGSGAVSAPFSAVEDAEVIICIGTNSTDNHPVAATYFKQAAKDKTLILMDPRKTALTRHATHALQFSPGSDVAMLNALLNVIVTEELCDEAYVSQRTEGFENLKKHVLDFTPEEMSPICGIAAETLRTVARKYATAKSSIIFWGMGVSQHIHGTDNVRCLIALALITGQIGRPGTGLHPLRGQNNVQGASDAGLIPMMFPDYKRVDVEEVRADFEKHWGTNLQTNAGLTVVEIIEAIHEKKIKGMYIMGENPAMSDPNVDHARAGLAKLECLVVQDIFLTETAFHADVVLPATAWPEKNGTVTNTNRQVQMGRQAINPPGDAKADWWIIQQIALQMGCEWSYTHPREVFTEMGTVMPSLNNITWGRVEREDSVTYPCDGPDVPGNDIVFVDGFPTSSGRGKLVAASIIPPDETPDAEYPLILTTGRQLEHWHTGAMTRRASVLDAVEPEAVACFSPRDMRNFGLETGRMVKVATRRGTIELVARADSAVADGMVFIPFCYAEAPANALTNAALDPFGKIPEFKYCAARVETVGS